MADYGYPKKDCKRCSDCELKVDPHFKAGGKFKLMLIGQDPTIFRKTERVKEVLMLDQKNSQLSRWLTGIFGEETFNEITLYATNLVKCTFHQPPSTMDEGGLQFLKPFFDNCKEYLKTEISSYCI